MDLKVLKTHNNVNYLTEEQQEVSKTYILVREKENRILEDSEVFKLPNVNFNEWPIRKKSANRFLRHIKAKGSSLNILDLGCGNGWFSNQIASVSEKNIVIGLDINAYELEQAARIFKSENLKFVFADVFQLKNQFEETFNIITLNGVVQYFPDFNLLIKTLNSFLRVNGEIHIIDSPFYAENEIENAQKRTEVYYSNLGFPEMANSYFHHSKKHIENFKKLYKPKNVLLKKLYPKDSPFYWLMLEKS